MQLTARRRQSGISMVEVLVGLGIVAILIGVAMPAFRVYIQNTQIRSAAESIVNGMQATRNEAIRRNASMEFTLHDGTAWDICPASSSYPCPTPFMTRTHEEGSQNATLTTLPDGSATVAFNGLGRVVPNADGTDTMSQVNITNPQLPAADARNLRVVVTPGGAIKLCDPRVAAGDPRAC